MFSAIQTKQSQTWCAITYWPEALRILKRRGRLLRFCGIVVAMLVVAPQYARGADDCPTTADQITTDRPDLTASSETIPRGSVQIENGLDWTVWRGSNAIAALNTELRFGIAHCTEFFIDAPNYVGTLNKPEPSGFSNIVVSFKRELAASRGFTIALTAGSGFPTGDVRVTGPGYQPYLALPWSYDIGSGWGVAGMFDAAWSTSDSSNSVTFEPTFEIERDLGASADAFLECVGTYGHQRASHLLDGGFAWRFRPTQQVDLHLGFGLNRSTNALDARPSDRFFGVGYSIRLDNLFDNLAGSA